MYVAPLTPRQLELLRFVQGYLEAHGFGPSLREMAAGLALAGKSSIHRELCALEAHGLVRRLRRRERAIEVLLPPAIPRAPDGAPLFHVPIDFEGDRDG